MEYLSVRILLALAEYGHHVFETMMTILLSAICFRAKGMQDNAYLDSA